MSKCILLLLLLPFCAFALEIQSETQNTFIFADKVVNLSSSPCQSDGVFFIPENSSYFGEEKAPGIPFRTYTIALPNSALPSVSVENLKTEAVSGKPCGAELNVRSLKIGEPYLQDNLWRVKINVPLLFSNGNSWSLRKSFRVKIDFNGSASGHSVGKRAISRVENKKAAARFGQTQASSAGLRKVSAANIDAAKNIEWLFRIGVGNSDLSTTADGMYGVSFSDLRGIETGIRVDNLMLFGASPDTLSEVLDKEVFPNVEEIPILVKDKNNNGIFDAGDSIIFFGTGTAIWKKSGSQSGMDYYFSHSPYSFYQNYYLGVGTENGKRLGSIVKNIAGTRDIDWKKYARSEKDLMLRDNYFGGVEENTGKEWFWAWGETGTTVRVESADFQNSVRDMAGLKSDSVWIGVSYFPLRSTESNPSYSQKPWKDKIQNINFRLYFQNQELKDIIDTIFGGTFVLAGKDARTANNLYRLEMGRENDRFDGLSVAYYYSTTQSSGDEWLFPGNASGAVRIPVPENTEQIVKIKDFIPVEILEKTAGYANDTISVEGDTKYFLHRKNSYKAPAFIEAIPNRINSVSEPREISTRTEYLILTSETLQNSAAKLKRFRESGEAATTLNTEVVLVEEIYRLHGAHSSPVAIRDYIRFAKSRCPDLQYVLLAGNGHYDYRKLRQNSKDNLIPPYEAEDHSTDDFFAVLDSGYAVRFGTYELSVAVGRLPVSNATEFENYIQKAIEYEKTSDMDNGIWRNTIIFNSDDDMQGTTIDRTRHTYYMEKTVTLIDSLSLEHNSAIDWRKISLLQYKKDGSNKKPEATKELLLRLNQGALFTLYYGHGGAVMWADEDLLNVASLSKISNARRYTILGSFSCVVARFDDVAIVSLSEAFVNAKSKGAIASIGSLRNSYPDWNEVISKNILTHSLFTPNILLGKAFLEAKQSVSLQYSKERHNNEKYVLLGEPVLSMPRREISLNLNSVPDTIQALQKLKISGRASVENGLVNIQVLESEKLKTLSPSAGNDDATPTQIKIDGNPIYSEELQIKNGAFSTEFITPRKLSLGDTSAQIRLWGYKPGTAGVGKKMINGISLSGTSPYADSIKDNTPPSIKIYPCMQMGIATPYAENAHVSLEIPACLNVVIEDSTGIDYREEADEGIFFELNPIENSWHPWSFSERTGKRAVTVVNFGTSYDPGEYVFKVNAQDILGNAAFRSLKISLSQENNQGLADVFNVPNPVRKSGTTFYFKNLSGDRQSDVKIRIFDQNGKLVKTINNAVSGRTHWDGKDSRGRLLANGLYHYVVQSTVQPLTEGSGGKKVFEKKQKLLISR